MAEDESRLDALIARAGVDKSALGQLFARYRPFLVAVARQRIGPRLAVRADASDVVQQTLAEAHQAFAGFQGATEPEFSAWIKRIHDRNLAEAVRKHVGAAKQSIDRERPIDDADASVSFRWLEPAADQTTPSQQLIKGEKALLLAEAIESLPEMQREAVRLRHIEGWGLEDIAKELDRSVVATAGLIKRGLQTLRTRMADHSSGWLVGLSEIAPMAQNSRDNAAEDPADRAFAEYMLRRDRGEHVDREAFVRQHPETTEELRAFFADSEAVRLLAGDAETVCNNRDASPGKGIETTFEAGEVGTARSHRGRHS